MQPGLIYNPLSQRNRASAALHIAPDFPYAAPTSRDELLKALRGFVARGVDLVIVSGGDGTLREVTTMLPHAYGERLPCVSVLSAGNANVVGADVGSAGYGQAAFDALLQAASDERFSKRARRRLLRVRWPDLDVLPVLGFVCGGAVVSQATRHANERVLTRGVTHQASVIVTVAVALWRAAWGRPGWVGAESMSIAIDDAAPRQGARFIFMATTLNQLMLGLWPFWGGEGSAAPLRWLDIDSPPPRLLRSLPRVLRGRPPRGDRSAYRSDRAERIRLVYSDPLIIDGERFAPGPSGIVEIDTDAELEFVTP
ncbi:diacylglycerol/lipid kinase family protein [Solimonas marina]|uniref:DAGKc domain-containing protein n=1 Tax=Solimonas marina TaxID=2714601 RepID=A0A970B9G0_9GAMM|nr:diacylglycerol kinase family protein [Solimonas marina]NKF23304.1 hypothetical protein [Solimonas marina]